MVVVVVKTSKSFEEEEDRQVSISTIFYDQLVRTKEFFAAFLCLQFVFAII